MSSSISSAMRRTISVRCSTRDDVAHRDEVLDLERGQLRGDLDEAVLVALEGLQGLVGPVEQPRDRLERVLLVAGVDGDDRHVLGHRDHRHVDRAGHPLGGAVPGAGLRRGHVRVRHEVHVGPGDAAGVGGQDDGAVHLRQLRQALRAEGGVEQEAARADVQHVGTVADDDERAHARLEDAVEAGAQRACPARRPPSADRSSALRLGAIPQCYVGEADSFRGALRRRHEPSEVDRLGEGGGPQELDARRAGGRAGGDDGPAEAEAGRLGQPAGGLVDLAQLAAEARPRRTPRGRRRTGRPLRADTSARASARSAPGSTTFTPPATTAYTSVVGHTGADPLVEHGEHERRGDRCRGPAPSAAASGGSDCVTSACTSTSSGRWPSSTGATTEPAMPGRRSARNSADGSGTPTRPSPVISNRPSSSVEPKRCLAARRSRSAWWRSPSNDSTVSTRCSSTRGPARPPSLVTWPTRTWPWRPLLGRPHQAVGAVAHLGDRAGGRRQRRVEHGLDRVDDHDVGPHRPRGGRARGAATVSATSHRFGGSAPSRSARSRTCWADSSAVTYEAAAPGLGQPGQRLEEQRGLADARLAAEQRDRARARARPAAPGRAPPSSVGRAAHASVSTSAIGIGTPAVDSARPTALAATGCSISSTSVFHASQAAQRPAHFGSAAPQSVHRYTVLVRAMAPNLRTPCDSRQDPRVP